MLNQQARFLKALTVLWAGALIQPSVELSLAQDMSPTTEQKVKKAAVHILMGEKKDGEDALEGGAQGSGAFINQTGLVLTNDHVVNPAHGKNPFEAQAIRAAHSIIQYRVVVDGGTENEKIYKADLIYNNSSADLALLQVYDQGDNDQLLASPHYLKILSTDRVIVGDRCWLFGYPGGDKMKSGTEGKHAAVTVTAGNITEINRSPGGRFLDVITDVQAAPGNSGGPMVNVNGDLIGVVATIGGDQKSSTGVNSRCVPGSLAMDLIRVTMFFDKVAAATDLKPFLNYLRDIEGYFFLPGLPRDAKETRIIMKNGSEISGTIEDTQLLWKTDWGSIIVPTRQAAYAIEVDGNIKLLLDGGEVLAANARDVEFKFKSNRGREFRQSLANVDKIIFAKSATKLSPPNVNGITIEGGDCRFVVTDVEGEIVFEDAETGTVKLTLDEIREIEPYMYQRQVHTVEGTTYTGKFGAHSISAKMAWTGEIVSLNFEQIREARFRRGNPSKSDVTNLSLADKLQIALGELENIAGEIEAGELEAAYDTLTMKLEKDALRDLPKPMQNILRVLNAELMLRQGKYDEARDAFKKIRSRTGDNEIVVKWYAAARYHVLDTYEDGTYQGEPLSDPEVFDRACGTIVNDAINRARTTVVSYEKAMPDSHRGWKRLLDTLDDHEEELRISASLVPGRGESDIYRIWRFKFDTMVAEVFRLRNSTKDLERKVEDFKGDGSYNSRVKAEGLRKQQERIQNEWKELERQIKDLDALMQGAGFRIDDPKAVDILD